MLRYERLPSIECGAIRLPVELGSDFLKQTQYLCYQSRAPKVDPSDTIGMIMKAYNEHVFNNGGGGSHNEYVYDKDGNCTVYKYDKDGKCTVYKYDKDGKCTV